MLPSGIPQRPSKATEAGFSLVEMLVTLAITVMVGVSLISALMAIATNQRRESQMTEYYESLRLAAHTIIQDARQARKATSDGAWLKLYMASPEAPHAPPAESDDYIKYTFARWDGSVNGIPDGGTLHRWVVDVRPEGEVLQSDSIVALGLEPYCSGVNSANCTQFSSTNTSYDKHAWASLVKPKIRGQQAPTRMEVWGVLR